MATVYSYISIFYSIMFFNGLGFLTAVIQKLLTAQLIQNVELPYIYICLELSVVVTSIIYYQLINMSHFDTMISDKCKTVMDMDPETIETVDRVYTYMSNRVGTLNFKANFTVIVLQNTLLLIFMLEKTAGIGELILMISHMLNEFKKFMLTFGFLLCLVIILSTTLSKELKTERNSFSEIV